MPGHGSLGRAAQTLALLYAGTSLTVPITFWYLYETMRDPSIHDRVQQELKNHANAETNSYNFMPLTTRPLLQSMHAETTRMYSSNLTVREVIAPTYALDEKYTIEKGTTVFMSSKYIGTFEKVWAQSRPQALTRPLNTFWAERYLVSSGKGEEKRERSSDAGLTGNWTSFGGGEHKCPGRHFARNIGIVTLAVLMGVFEVEIIDVEKSRRFDPELKGKAFGTMKPQGTVAARIRRRGD
jgi:cytochrome P450